MNQEVRVRFAPSPTGGLHLGGVRTALFAYLFAKKHHGKFILRIEDTDQNRFVEGAEDYIVEALLWTGIGMDESPALGGDFGPYRQSERKEIYKKYALELIEKGHAYYAFDKAEELEQMRTRLKSESNPSPQYDGNTRMQMKNSLSMLADEVKHLLENNTPYVIRIKVPDDELISFDDIIRGEIKNESKLLDDKVLLKADGMPTYHLAVVVDDYLMKISHVFRGEEWLPSAPIHVLLWKFLNWEHAMPKWAHLPLILKPDGNGKLSKRDGERLGFPVFPLSWQENIGFREKGFLPQAFANMLAMLGWNDGSEQEVFSMQELIEKFEISRIHKAGAKFSYEKAIWFNTEWFRKLEMLQLLPLVQTELEKIHISPSESVLEKVIELTRDRVHLLSDIPKEMAYFFQYPQEVDEASIKTKWDESHTVFYIALLEKWSQGNWSKEKLEIEFKELITRQNLKIGAYMMPLRVMLVGGKFGPGVFDIAFLLGFDEVKNRIEKYL